MGLRCDRAGRVLTDGDIGGSTRRARYRVSCVGELGRVGGLLWRSRRTQDSKTKEQADGLGRCARVAERSNSSSSNNGDGRGAAAVQDRGSAGWAE
jgi:hypothetical protein